MRWHLSIIPKTKTVETVSTHSAKCLTCVPPAPPLWPRAMCSTSAGSLWSLLLSASQQTAVSSSPTEVLPSHLSYHTVLNYILWFCPPYNSMLVLLTSLSFLQVQKCEHRHAHAHMHTHTHTQKNYPYKMRPYHTKWICQPTMSYQLFLSNWNKHILNALSCWT